MDPITPGTWPQAVIVAVFLWLFAWLPVLAYPRTKSTKRRRVTAGYLVGMAVLTTGIAVAGTFAAPALGGLGVLLYALIVGAWSRQAIKARRRKRELVRNINREIKARNA